MRLISVKEVEYIAFKVANDVMTKDEPIPDFSSRFTGILKGCVAAPFQKFNSRFVYRGLIGKASVLFYLMVKNHPFQNGNKRIAITTLLTFLYLNKKWLKVDQQEFYNFAIWIASSPAALKDEAIKGTEKFLKKYLIAI